MLDVSRKALEETKVTFIIIPILYLGVVIMDNAGY